MFFSLVWRGVDVLGTRFVVVGVIVVLGGEVSGFYFGRLVYFRCFRIFVFCRIFVKYRKVTRSRGIFVV